MGSTLKPGKLASLAILISLGAGCGSGESPARFSGVGEPTAKSDASLATQASADVPFRRILCFGDSLTYGVTLESGSLTEGARGDLTLVEGYVPKLWRRLEQKYGPGFELVNAGIPGETTTDGVERIRDELRVYDPDLVLLLEGVVDVNNTAPRFPVVRENLATMMHLVRREGKLVIIGTYPLLNPDGFRTSGAEFIPRLNVIIRQEAAQQSVRVADHEKALPDLSGQGPDGLHPNNNGYEAMADTWLAAIEALAQTLVES
jgi:lysophospholipase L1-like esterase